MKINMFEDFEVYKAARILTGKIYTISKQTEFNRDFGLRDQARRAAISIMANIAEGFERKTNPDFVRFLFIAKGSCGELRAHLTIALDQKYINSEDYEALYDNCKKISSMLSNPIKHLSKN